MHYLIVLVLIIIPSLSFANNDQPSLSLAEIHQEYKEKDFKNLDCNTYSELAELIVENWLNGTSKDEMIKNSSTYGRNLAYKSMSDYHDVSLYTYLLSQEAMHEPRNQSIEEKKKIIDFYKKFHLDLCEMKQNEGSSSLAKYTKDNLKNDSDTWKYFIDTDEFTLYYRAKSLAYDELKNPTLWFRQMYKQPKNGVYSNDMLFVLDCSTRKVGISHLVEYGMDNQVIKENQVHTYMADMHSFRIGSPTERIYKLGCES